MEKILITGATRFIGSHLTELCVEKGYEVIAFDRYNPNNNFGWLENTKWKPEIEIDRGLDMTIDWLRKFKDLYKHNIYHI